MPTIDADRLEQLAIGYAARLRETGFDAAVSIRQPSEDQVRGWTMGLALYDHGLTSAC